MLSNQKKATIREAGKVVGGSATSQQLYLGFSSLSLRQVVKMGQISLAVSRSNLANHETQLPRLNKYTLWGERSRRDESFI